MRKMTLVVAAMMLVFSPLLGGGAMASDGILVEAVTVNVVPSGTTASAFMVITNQGSEDDRLVSCMVKEIPSARCEIHNVEDGKMFPVEGVDVEAGKTLLLKKGSYHIMVMDMAEPLSDNATLVLNFSHQGAVEAPALVKKAEGGMGGMGEMMKSEH